MEGKCPLVILSTYHHEHPQKVMSRLGIQYLYAVPQSMGSCWQFYGCENIPDEIPEDDKKYFDFECDYKDPKSSIGYGLSNEMAEKIQAWIDKN
ncbi:hypothetical protein [Citrobacter amalonaticus]|uniref:hypothetical protein n=1 Tax=Citrobacter amalonaticus TaxID=35703 RepID=UPI003563F5B6